MNKEEMVNALAKESGLTKRDSEIALDSICRVITNVLASGGKIQLVGFGTFEVKDRAPRTGRNPRANTPVHIPAKAVPVFRPGVELKTMVSNHSMK